MTCLICGERIPTSERIQVFEDHEARHRQEEKVMTTRELAAQKPSPTDEKLDRMVALLEQILEELKPTPQTKRKR